MPINKKPGESKDDFISRCIAQEISSGKEQDQAAAICYSKWEEFKTATQSVSDNTWSTEAPISVVLESYTDYPEAAKRNAQIALDWAEKNGWGDCGTSVGKQRANQLAKGEPISRDTIARMAAFERHRQNSQGELGDGCGRLMWQAWGGDEGIEWAQRKLRQIDSENLSSIKCNCKVTPKNFKKILVSEDLEDSKILDYIESGYMPHILSKSTLRKKDKKRYKRLKSLGLSEDIDLKFGDVKSLHSKYKYNAIDLGDDALISMLESMGRPLSDYQVLRSVEVNSRNEAINISLKGINLKFVKIRTVYTYELRNDFAGQDKVIDTTRDFCRRIVSLNKSWTLDEIDQISGSHLTKMGLPDDVFAFTGGFYRFPGTLNTTPFCRHTWKANVVIEP